MIDWCSDYFDAHGYSHAAPNAQCSHASFSAHPSERVEQGDQDTCPRCTYGMAESDGTAIDVHLHKEKGLELVSKVAYRLQTFTVP